MSAAGRATIWVLLAVAAIAGMGLPIYRAGSQSAIANPDVAVQADPEISDQVVAVALTSAQPDIQIPTRLTIQTNGTVSVWFEGQADGVYRIDYTDIKTATPEEMAWKLAGDDIQVITNGWAEWVDAGAVDRPAPGEVRERYYRVVLKTNVTMIAAGETTQQSPIVPGTGPDSGEGAIGVGGVNGRNGSPASIPAEILRALQKQGALSQWRESRSARNLEELHECERLGELVAGGTATEDKLRDALATSKLRVSMLMTLGQNLFRSGDRHHAEMFFQAVVQHHAKRATAKQVARSHLWLGKMHQDDGLDWKYQRGDTERARPEFEAAAVNFLRAKDASKDWVRGSSWLGAAACYRELGDQEKRRECLQQLMTEQEDQTEQRAANSASTSQADKNVGPRQRDIANSLLADSYYEEERWQEAGQTYQQMRNRLGASDVAEQYPGQKQYLDQLNTSLRWCNARGVEQAVSASEVKVKAAP